MSRLRASTSIEGCWNRAISSPSSISGRVTEALERLRPTGRPTRTAKESARLLEQSLRARSERLRDIELLRFQTAELDAARLSLEEEAALAGRATSPLPAEELQRNLSAAAELLKSEGSTPTRPACWRSRPRLRGLLPPSTPQIEALATALREATTTSRNSPGSFGTMWTG